LTGVTLASEHQIDFLTPCPGELQSSCNYKGQGKASLHNDGRAKNFEAAFECDGAYF